jgi:flavin-dependent dehydrogenase
MAGRDGSNETMSDAVVVGGRVAGALTAAYLAEAGMEVVVLESAAITSGTISTHFFRGDGLVRSLDELGLLEQVLATQPPRLTCEYWYPEAGQTPEVGPAQEPGDLGYCLSVRRQTLDPLVAERVSQHPRVTWLSHRRVVALTEGGHGLVDATGARHLAPLVVGADGRRSTVARLVGASVQRNHAAARVLAYRYVTGFEGPSGDPGAEFSLRGDEMAYVFPSDSATTCVAVTVPIGRDAELRVDAEAFFDARMSAHRGLARRYAASKTLGRVVVGHPTPDYVREAAGAGWALVGDAGVHQDPWSGLGMDGAARQARALGQVVTRHGWPANYAKARDEAALAGYEETVAAADDLSVLADE